MASEWSAVPMRDGVRLQTLVQLPDRPGRFPALIYRTPYGIEGEARDHAGLLQAALDRGFAVVMQDVRGRYGSEGVFTPYRQEGSDGYDAIEWVARRPWCNGAVGGFGLSYPAAAQLLAAVEAPPHLRAIVPAMGFSRPDHFFYFGGVFDLSWPHWIAAHILPDARARAGLGPVAAGEAAALAATPPLLRDSVLAEAVPEYREWLRHPPASPWWDWADVRTRLRAAKVSALHLSSWHDEAYGALGAIENFQAMAGSGRRQELVLGPWTHGVDATGTTISGSRAMGPRAAIAYDDLVLDFLERQLKPESRAPPPAVRAYVMGIDRWVGGDRWPLPGTERRSWFLGPEGLGGRSGHGARSFVSDPARPVTFPKDLSYGAFDLSGWVGRPDVVVFDSPPLEDPLLVLGRLTVELWVDCSTPDADLFAWILDVDEKGRAFNLMSPGACVRRLSTVPPATGGRGPRRVVFENLVTGNCFLPGHRIRLLVAPSLAGSLAPNLQTGESEHTGTAFARSELVVRFGREWPSRIELEVLPRLPGGSGKFDGKAP